MLEIISNFIIFAPPFLVAIILHEIAHGYIALKLGDPTAKSLGRITLNPLKHIDFKLSILLPGILILIGSPVIFGGAKPVPVNPLYFKNPRKGMALVAIAGPVTNFILAFLAFLLIKFLPEGPIFRHLVAAWLVGSVTINVVLALFNLLPIPPLDGGRILVGILPVDLARKFSQIEKHGLLILFLILYLGIPELFIRPIISRVNGLVATEFLKLEDPSLFNESKDLGAIEEVPSLDMEPSPSPEFKP